MMISSVKGADKDFQLPSVMDSRISFLPSLPPSLPFSLPPSLPPSVPPYPPPSRQAESASEKSAGGAIATFAFFLSIIFGIFSVFLLMWRQYLPVRAPGREGGREGGTEGGF